MMADTPWSVLFEPKPQSITATPSFPNIEGELGVSIAETELFFPIFKALKIGVDLLGRFRHRYDMASGLVNYVHI